MAIQLSYRIYEVLDSGQLMWPKKDWGTPKFKDCTTAEECMKQIENLPSYERWSEYTILTMINQY